MTINPATATVNQGQTIDFTAILNNAEPDVRITHWSFGDGSNLTDGYVVTGLIGDVLRIVSADVTVTIKVHARDRFGNVQMATATLTVLSKSEHMRQSSKST